MSNTLREEWAEVCAERDKLLSLVNTAAQPIRNALERFDALVTDEEAQSPGNRLSAAVKRDRAAVEGLRTLLGRVERRASDKPAPDVQTGLDVQTALADALEGIRAKLHEVSKLHVSPMDALLAISITVDDALRAAGRP